MLVGEVHASINICTAQIGFDGSGEENHKPVWVGRKVGVDLGTSGEESVNMVKNSLYKILKDLIKCDEK